MNTVTPPVNSFLPVQAVVRSFMNEKKEQSLTYFKNYLQIAIEGWSDLSVFEMNAVSVAYIPVVNGVAQLPSDFITYTKIGVKVCNKIWTLTMNNDIAIPRPETICPIEPDCICETTDASEYGGYYFFPHYRYGSYIGTLYGISGGFNQAYYRVDMKQRLIYFEGYIPNDEIVLEYKSSGVTSGNIVIPRNAVPALKGYLHWKTQLYDPRIGDGAKMNLERLYNIELVKLHQEQCSFTMSEFLDSMYESYSQAPKR